MSCSPKNPCSQYSSAECVTYTGPNIPCIGVLTNDRLDVVIQKIATILCGGGTTTTTTTSSTTTFTTTVPLITAYWGWVADPASINSANAVTSLSHGTGSFVTGATITADFRSNTSPLYLWMAEPAAQPLKTKWFGTDLNKGNIGTDQDLFGAPTTVEGFRVYFTNFPTQQNDTTLQFKVS
jgi:hypothetical protein